MTRVLLVDDHPVVREGVAAVLAAEPDMKVVGQVATAEEALRQVGGLNPDVVVVDLHLPGMSGIEACARLRERRPKVRVVILTRFRSERMLLEAFEAGAVGFLVKESDPEGLRAAVRTVAEGGTYVDPRVERHVPGGAARRRRFTGPFGLTRQELRVIELLPRGLSNREIAEVLEVSMQTVKTHLHHAMRKMQVHDRVQAAAIAIREGLA